MNLAFERVMSDEDDKISVIYEIIKSCGEDMFQKQGLMHWRTPYPKVSIQKNCAEREVFLVRDLDTNQYVHTIQLEFITSNENITTCCQNADNETEFKVVNLNKGATIPQASGKGIGKQCFDYIENYCRNRGISRICFDVYDKSEHAVQFFENIGYTIVGSKPTRYFTVYIMEKTL